MSSPKRIAVVVLAVACGFALRYGLGWTDAPWIGLLLGVIAAQLVPGKGACPVPRRKP